MLNTQDRGCKARLLGPSDRRLSHRLRSEQAQQGANKAWIATVHPETSDFNYCRPNKEIQKAYSENRCHLALVAALTERCRMFISTPPGDAAIDDGKAMIETTAQALDGWLCVPLDAGNMSPNQNKPVTARPYQNTAENHIGGGSDIGQGSRLFSHISRLGAENP